MVDLHSGRTLHYVQVQEKTPSGALLTRNPVAFELWQGKVRLYCVPEDGRGSLYVLEPAP